MILVAARGLSRQFDTEPVFRDVDFEIRRGEKVALVGPNGTGKSTLLRILAGFDEPDVGAVERPASIVVEMLEQEPDFNPAQTLLDEAKTGLAKLYALQAEAMQLAHRMSAESDGGKLDQLHRRYDTIQGELHRLDAYHVDHRVDEVLLGLGFGRDDYDRRLDSFSGGQRNRVLLAKLLLRSPDVMLLDEPTNHLDIAATEWLEEYLSRSDAAMLVVSHDRYFLDRVTNRTLELFDRRLTDYTGNFSAYWRQRGERNELLQKQYERQQEFVAKTEDFIRRNKSGQKHAQATDRERKLSRMAQVEMAREIEAPPMTFGQAGRTGDWVIDAVKISKGFGQPLFTELTVRVMRGDRIGLLGPNGCGKTTLLRTLLGEIEPDEGIVRLGTGVKVGYFDQQLASVRPDQEAIDAILPPDNPAVPPGQLRSLLARFGIRGDMAFQTVGSMSGGERSKVALARIAAQNVNLLVLDEPTNHLDLWSRAVLEDALKAFEGTLVFVSHDRYFLDRVAEQVIVFETDRLRFYEGNYSDYTAFLRNQSQASPAEAKSNMGGLPASPEFGPSIDGAGPENGSRTKNDKRKRRFPYRKVDELEAEIAEQEQLLSDLQSALADPDVHRDGERVKETLMAFEETRSRLEFLYEHWEEAVELNYR